MDRNALIQQLLPLLSPPSAQLFQQADQETQDLLLQVFQQAGPQEVEQALQEFAAQVGAVDPTQQPGVPPQAGPQPQPLPQGPPPGPSQPPVQVPPPGMLGPDPSLPPQLPPEANVPPNGQPNDGLAAVLPPQEAEDTPPDWKPPAMKPSRFKDSNPSLERVLEDGRLGRQLWQARDLRIALDTSMYHLEYELEDADPDMSDDVAFIDGELLHRRSDPAALVDRVTGMVEARQDRVTIHMPKRHESDEYRKAAQSFEDFSRSFRMVDEENWFERGSTMGDPQPPLPRKEAGLMALEGGFGWCWHVDPDDEDHPFEYEVVPISQLYPLGHATTRQFTLPLHMARAQFPEIEAAYPLKDGQARSYYDSMYVRIIEWADTAGYRYAAAWAEDSIGPSSGRGDRSGWIVKPRPIGYGFPYFNYVIWGGTPTAPNNYNKSTHNKNIGYGILTPLRKTYRLMDIMVSAVATGALKVQAPPLFRTVNENRDMTKVPRINTDPGAENFGRPGEEVKPMVFDIAASQSGVAFIQSLAQELSNNIPPMLAGMSANSGFEYMQRSDDANAMFIAPMIDALQRSYEMQHRQRGVLAYRYAKRGKRDKGFEKQRYFTRYAYTGTSKRGYTYQGVLKPSDIEKSGVSLQVRYTQKTLTEQMQLANMVSQLVQAHLMSQEQALIKLGNDDPYKELLKIFQDAALMQPEVLKAMTEESILSGGNDMLKQAWLRAFAQAGQGGSPPSQPGMASQPGGANPNLPPEMTHPTQMTANLG